MWHFATVVLSMETAFFEFFVQFCAGFLGGLTAGYGLRWASSRRCARLEWAVGDIQGRLSGMQGKKAATARWEREADVEAQLAAMMTKPAAQKRRYDNDPLGE